MSPLQTLTAILVAVIVSVTTLAQQTDLAEPSFTAKLWPERQMPGKGADAPEGPKPNQGDHVLRITNVSDPALAVYKAPGTQHAAPAVIICPGGGYGLLAYDKEGTEVAAWLNSIGITGVVLKYRVPNNRDGAFQDIQRAVRLVRTHAEKWGIDQRRVGVIGFSAGGHLCARLSTSFETTAYPPLDAVDQADPRPDFALLIYPAYLITPTGNLAPELPISARIPPVFIAHTEDDTAFVAGSKVFHAALEAAHLPVRFCLFADGGHGYGLRSKKEAGVWPQRCQEWLNERGILP